MAIAGTLVTRFGYDGIRSGATIDEVVDIARYAATHETPWEDVGCTALVWAITNLAGVPINQAWNAGRAVNNNPTTPGAASEQGYAVTADLAGDGWDRTNLINRDNPYAAIAVGDILRLEAVNTSGAYGQHSMIVTRYYGSDPTQIWVVDNQNGEVTEHLLSDVVAGMNNNGGIVTFLRHRLDESYVAENIPNGTEGWAEGRFYSIAEDLPGDTSATAVLELGTSLDGAIDFSGDSDWFKIWLVAGNSYSFAVRGAGSGR
ncbi:hypothetical protein [Donghicola mangrovi]|uniref:Uncharacterized protein n=1 Tax=Donghicola mangrovi TaxID=2729614 RepID=A0A850Q6M0_9RHOB|nr:hypothetical protein [Donghicola mangrovi]NVO24776.1 hypothetical protein [Donghicola mangrovi]